MAGAGNDPFPQLTAAVREKERTARADRKPAEKPSFLSQLASKLSLSGKLARLIDEGSYALRVLREDEWRKEIKMNGSDEARFLAHARENGLSGKSLANLMAIVAHESGFKPVAEAMYTRPERAKEMFRALKAMSLTEIKSVIDQGPEVFWEAVYGYQTAKGRDIGNKVPGDGAKYRGKGVFQLTGRGLYEAFQRDTGYPVVEKPDLLLTDLDVSYEGAIWYWKKFVAARGKDLDINAAVSVVNPGILDKSELMTARQVAAARYLTVVG